MKSCERADDMGHASLLYGKMLSLWASDSILRPPIGLHS
jgi:hypothetical protein